MVGLEDFLIQFEKPEKIYSPGDDISGQLVIDLREREKFDMIKVEGQILQLKTRPGCPGVAKYWFFYV